MLFRKKITPSCSYCAYGTRLSEDQYLCSRKGPVSAEQKCIHFRYDPIKRTPIRAKALDFSKYDQEDYTL